MIWKKLFPPWVWLLWSFVLVTIDIRDWLSNNWDWMNSKRGYVIRLSEDGEPAFGNPPLWAKALKQSYLKSGDTQRRCKGYYNQIMSGREKTRVRAHEIWTERVEAGKPGNARQDWSQAKRELSRLMDVP